MGLDMYLYKVYFINQGEHYKPEYRYKINITYGGEPSHIPTDLITEIKTKVLYWRKANAIHQWFLHNVQEGEDDCGTHEVSKEQLQLLLDTINKILSPKVSPKEEVLDRMVRKSTREKKAKELLPTTSGFFFGPTDYDEYFFDELQNTAQQLKTILEDTNDKDLGWWFEYHSSW
jgi:hypothetical protein